MNLTRLISVFLILAISTNCTFASNGNSKTSLNSLLPPDAQGVKETKQAMWTQLSFTVNRDYPKYAFEEDQVNQWIKAGWNKCSTSSDWLNFPDYSKNQAKRTYQRSLYLVKNNELIILNGSYQSNEITSTNPDSTMQYGLIRWSNMTKEEKKLLCPTSK